MATSSGLRAEAARSIARPGKDRHINRVLTCEPDRRFARWAKAVGVKWGRLAAAERDDMICELDAVVDHLYGLDEGQLRHIFDTFHEGWDYHARMDAVLEHFCRWAGRR